MLDSKSRKDRPPILFSTTVASSEDTYLDKVVDILPVNAC